MGWDDILTRTPINSTAGRVVSQAGCAAELEALSREHLHDVIRRLESNRTDLKEMLGITSHTKHKNFMYRYNCRGRKVRSQSPLETKDAEGLYVRTGEAIQRCVQLLREMNAAEREVA